MLDRDKYNQDEYNDYYQQEIRDAETSGIEEEEPSKKGKILILLGLVILVVAGYFGYKTINSSTIDESVIVEKEVEKPTKTVQIVKEEPTKAVDSVETIQKNNNSSKQESTSTKNEESEQKEVLVNVQKVAESEPKMSPEEIAKVVQMVMSQINSKKELIEDKTKNDNNSSKKDKELISELSALNIDSIDDEDKKLEETINNIEETTKDTNINREDKVVDTYNKIKVSDNEGVDELSKLSNQISDLISDKSTPIKIDNDVDEKKYTQSIKREVITRKNEMRIIIVRKGDTLGKIAKRAYGNVMEYRKIYKANPGILNRPDRIYIGQKLRIPK